MSAITRLALWAKSAEVEFQLGGPRSLAHNQLPYSRAAKTVIMDSMSSTSSFARTSPPFDSLVYPPSADVHHRMHYVLPS